VAEIKWDRIGDEQRLDGDQVVPFVTATIRINGKGPFFYRAKKTDNWRAEMQAWAQQQAADVETLLS
jgi:Holliday junction resolvase RusA-like endonuclease